MSGYPWQDGDLILRLQVQPKSRKEAWISPHGDTLKLRITAPPVDGKTNQHLLKFLAKQFGVRVQDVELLSGEQRRQKRFLIRQPNQLPPLIAPGPNTL